MSEYEHREKIIGLASTSKRRRQALQQIPGVTVEVVPGGEELQIDDLITIALNKIAFAFPTILQMCQRHNKLISGIIAADTQTAIGVLDETGAPALRQKGKPTDILLVQEHFRQLYACAEKSGYGYYKVISASALQDQAGTISQTNVTKMVLNQRKLAHLQSEEGFSEYLYEFGAFYGSKTYDEHGLSGVTPFDISAGLSLPVLAKMNALESIAGTDLRTARPKDVEQAFKLGVLNVAIGFSEEVLSRIHREALQYLLHWAWLEEVAAYCLENKGR